MRNVATELPECLANKLLCFLVGVVRRCMGRSRFSCVDTEPARVSGVEIGGARDMVFKTWEFSPVEKSRDACQEL